MQDQRQLYIDAQNYFTGDGGRWQDRRRATDLLRQVCYNFASPIPSAARMLANCLETGQGVQMDLDEAMRLYQSIGDRQGVSRCSCKIEFPGSNGYPVSGVSSSSRPVPAPRAVASVASPPVIPARNAGAAVWAPRPRAPSKASAPQPSPLPLHIERIVLQVSLVMPLRIFAQNIAAVASLVPIKIKAARLPTALLPPPHR
jgi:hypothetical protein